MQRFAQRQEREVTVEDERDEDAPALGLADTHGSEVGLADTRASDVRMLRPGLAMADTQDSGQLAPPLGLADTRASDPDLRDRPLPLGSMDTVESFGRGAVVRPRFDDPQERRRRDVLKHKLFGDVASTVKIGRFRVLERLGAGGMGVVWAAYDERLDRKVAVKVLRPESTDQASRTRLLREAQAMARLSHPNIVGVHEVGEGEDGVFVAMEFVRGQGLDNWIAERRPWRDVLGVFIQAARGLQAAHEAGLVHRDFKPANAIVGADGRVKVLDFGLARAGAALLEPAAVGDGSLMDVHLTRTGAVLGTPLYMSPEQLAGADLTPASDQFSFFVSLYEGLYGALPFAGLTLSELAISVLQGKIAEPPANNDVPGWLRQVVWRGLSAEPEQRFADMNAAIAALERDPARVRRRWAKVAGLMLGAAGVSAGVVAASTGEIGRCEGLGARVEQVWNDESSDAARRAFATIDNTTGAATWALVAPRLAAWSDQWTALRRGRCQQYAAGELSDTLHDRSVACLERQLARVDALMTAFVAVDPAGVEQAAIAVAALPPLTQCTDPALLAAEVPLPDDPAARATVARGREQLEQARASIDLGRFDEALAVAGEVGDTARAIAYEPLQALAEAIRGDALQWRGDAAGAEQALTGALELALAQRDDRVAAEALARRIFVRAELAGAPDRGLGDAGVARALLRRVEGDDHLAWLLANNIAVATERAGDLEEASRGYEAALRHAGGIESAYTQFNLGLVNVRLFRLDRAEAALANAVTAAEAIVGADHPVLLQILEGEANVAITAGHLRRAREAMTHARRLVAAAPAANPQALVALAVTEARLAAYRRDPEAGRLAGEAERLAQAAFGPGPQVALTRLRTQVPTVGDASISSLDALVAHGPDVWGEALLARITALSIAGDHAELLRTVEAARAHPSFAAIPPAYRAAVELLAAEALIAQGRPAEGLAALDALAAIVADHAWLQRFDANFRGRAALALGDHAGAVTLLREAAGAYASYDEDHPEYAQVRFALARALRHTGAADEAETFARPALAAYQALGPGFAREAGEVEAWLAQET